MMKAVVILLVALTGLSQQVPVEVAEVTKVEVTEIIEVTTTAEPEIEITPMGECPEEDVDFPTYLSDMNNCSVFYQCAHGVPFRLQCRLPLEFNPVLNVCDYPQQAGCPLRVMVDRSTEEDTDDAAVVLSSVKKPSRDPLKEVAVVGTDNEYKGILGGVLGTVKDNVLDPVLDTVNGGILGPLVDDVKENVLDPVLNSVGENVLDPVMDTVNDNILNPILRPTNGPNKGTWTRAGIE